MSSHSNQLSPSPAGCPALPCLPSAHCWINELPVFQSESELHTFNVCKSALYTPKSQQRSVVINLSSSLVRQERQKSVPRSGKGIWWLKKKPVLCWPDPAPFRANHPQWCCGSGHHRSDRLAPSRHRNTFQETETCTIWLSFKTELWPILIKLKILKPRTCVKGSHGSAKCKVFRSGLEIFPQCLPSPTRKSSWAEREKQLLCQMLVGSSPPSWATRTSKMPVPN